MAILPGCVNTRFRTGDPLFAFVAADEPRAAALARDMLTAGGNAADAAAAMALMMTATLPSRVGFGGGGVCVTFDAAKRENRTLDFLPRGAGTAAVPAFLRGVYALQGTMGKLRWEQVAVQAEQAAYRNPAVSRAFAQDLAAHGNRLDADARRILMPGGQPPAEGTPLAQTDAGNLLSQVRRLGVGPIYNGSFSGPVAQALGIDPAALRGYQPAWRGTVSVPQKPYDLQFADLPEAGAGQAIAAAWKAGEDAPAAQRVARALQALGTGGGAEAPAAGFTVVDGNENAVSCAFTLGAPFGTGRMVPGTGMLGAVPVTSAGFGAPALLTNVIVGRTLFGGTGVANPGDGRNAGPAALLAAALPAVLGETQAPAIHAGRPADIPGRVSLVTCQRNTENLSKACQASGDPRAPGVGYVVEIAPPDFGL
ncbi:gamma-glutamyltransferase [Azospirillum oleiclasticum]|uniref:gamma-glutamyltransferase n=1 Tax=Azospirillum oleiclasticum TaxID=2735135 RepID=UPI0031B58EE5